MITITIAILIILSIGLIQGFNALLINPVFYICMAYIVIFDSLTVYADILNVIGLLILLSCYYVSYKTFSVRMCLRVADLLLPIRYAQAIPVKNITVFLAIFLSSGWMAYVYYLGSEIYGTYERYFVHFYSKYGFYGDMTGLELITLKYSRYFESIILIFIIILRYAAKTTSNKFVKLGFWWVFVVFLLLKFPNGVRSQYIPPVLAIICVDAIYSVRNNKKIVFTIGTYFVLLIVGIIFVTFTVARLSYFDNISEVIEQVNDPTNYSSNRSQMSNYAGQVGFYLSQCVEMFGEKRNHLGLHAPYTIITNPIPRVLWDNKPISFGNILAHINGYPKDNPTSLAAGIVGEAYADLGLLGVVLYPAIIGWLAGIVGKISKVFVIYGSVYHLPLGFLLMMFGAAFVRGDILTGWIFTVYPTIIFSVILLFYKIILKNKNVHYKYSGRKINVT